MDRVRIRKFSGPYIDLYQISQKGKMGGYLDFFLDPNSRRKDITEMVARFPCFVADFLFREGRWSWQSAMAIYARPSLAKVREDMSLK